ncbi:DUF4189 domain-containing protein [Nocardioides sp. JQ2195]|uniref:DUF4189 domain-containing protein n=1 Tax=Nocardioides sp. JQ2195 TaxID=2592334 RepID=UPI00143E9CCB|nr:DUF4189 domain-containing protein [Nocardioides sp. JQ2195]QIX27366.1 DUF4189 domain-containing protein [Nocardioides sp. JQ2195]
MRKTNRLLAVIATLLLTFGILAAFNTSASADPSTGPSAGTTAGSVDVAPTTAAYQTSRRLYYGAIHVNFKEFTGGYSYDKRTKTRAKKSSMAMCKANSDVNKRCKLALWVRNGCGAVAVRVKDGQVVKARTAIAFNKKKAIRKAKRKVGRGAERYAFVCTTRYR